MSLRELTEVEKAWLACAIDSEGWITFGVHKRKITGHPTLHPFVGISNTSKEYIDHARTITDFIKWGLRQEKHPPHRDLYSIRTDEQPAIREILTAVLPYLIAKKQNAEDMLRWLSLREQSKWSRYSQEEIAIAERVRARNSGPFKQALAPILLECERCGSRKNLEEDHIIPKKDWGLVTIRPSKEKTLSDAEVRELVPAIEKVLDSARNKRLLCRACHDYRHSKEGALVQLQKALNHPEPNAFKVSMWIFRLGIIEAFNTPELVLERGYRPYWSFPETRYSAWYPKIKLEKAGLLEKTTQTILAPS